MSVGQTIEKYNIYGQTICWHWLALGKPHKTDEVHTVIKKIIEHGMP